MVFLWGAYHFFRKSWPGQAIKRLSEFITTQVNEYMPDFFDPYSEIDPDGKKNSLRVLSRALDVLVEQKKPNVIQENDCEYVIEPKVKHFRAGDMSAIRFCYDEGRRAAMEAMPALLELMKKRRVM